MEESRNLIICLCFTLMIALVHSTESVQKLENAECKLRKVIVPVGDIHDPTNIYVPSAVELYQCGGSHSGNQGCAAVKSEQVTAEVNVHPKHMGAVKVEVQTFTNHTECAMRCSCNTRVYQCENTDTYKIPCPAGSVWNFEKCRCKGNVGCNQEANEDDEVSVSLTMFILALVIEFVIVLIALFLIMDACKYRRSESSVIHKTAEFVRSLSVRSHDGTIGGLRKGRSDTGSESFLNTYSASNGKINNV